MSTSPFPDRYGVPSTAGMALTGGGSKEASPKLLARLRRVETPIGRVPSPSAINTEGLDVAAGDLEKLLDVDRDDWKAEVPLIEEHYARLGDAVPAALRDELLALEKRLSE